MTSRRLALSLAVAGVVVAAACSSSPPTHNAAVPRSSTSAAVPSTPPVRPPPRSALQAFYRQRLHWVGCSDGFQCGRLRVPLDYSHPHGRQLSIAVIRLPAGDPQRRIGSLFVNPGGPGASGIDYTRSARLIFPSDILARFDIVSFDPRGVGRSAPVKCFTDRELDRALHVNLDPATPAQMRAVVVNARHWANTCLRRNGAALLSHVDTREAARDMDLLRAAVHDRALTYIGESYGTYLGAEYANLFPTRVRALVLDGAVDPTVGSLRLDVVQAAGFQTDLTDFIADCVKRGNCPLGRTAGAAQRMLSHLDRVAASRGFHTSGGRIVGDAEWVGGLASALYATYNWAALRAALAQAKAGDGTSMLRLNDQLVERDTSGHYTNLEEAFVAISCVDRPQPRAVGAYAAAAAQAANLAPTFGRSNVWSSLPCAFWPVPPVAGLQPLRAAGAPPIVVVGTTHDPATPYAWARHLAAQLQSGVLLTRDGDGHTAYGNSFCIDDAVNHYLLTAHPPANGTVCH